MRSPIAMHIGTAPLSMRSHPRECTAVRRVRAAGPGARACRFLPPRPRRERPGSAPAGAANPTNHRRCRRASSAFAGRVPPSRPTPRRRRPWLTCRGWSAAVRIICFAPSSSCLESHPVSTATPAGSERSRPDSETGTAWRPPPTKPAMAREAASTSRHLRSSG